MAKRTRKTSSANKPSRRPSAAAIAAITEFETPCTHALTVRQPWAWALVTGWKPIENRSYNTNFRGTVAIHASASYSDMQGQVGEQTESFLVNLHPDLDAELSAADPDSEAGINSYPVLKGRPRKQVNMDSLFHFGAIIGTVDIIDSMRADKAAEIIEVPLAADGKPSTAIHPIEWAASSGYCWLVQNAVKFATPIECKGRVRMFDMDNRQPGLAALVAAERKRAIDARLAK